jgi:hypothetical protein
MTINRNQTLIFFDDDIKNQDLITVFFKLRNFNVV